MGQNMAAMTASPSGIIYKKHRQRERGRDTEKEGGGKRERKKEGERGNQSPDSPRACALPPPGPSPQHPGE